MDYVDSGSGEFATENVREREKVQDGPRGEGESNCWNTSKMRRVTRGERVEREKELRERERVKKRERTFSIPACAVYSSFFRATIDVLPSLTSERPTLADSKSMIIEFLRQL